MFCTCLSFGGVDSSWSEGLVDRSFVVHGGNLSFPPPGSLIHIVLSLLSFG